MTGHLITAPLHEETPKIETFGVYFGSRENWVAWRNDGSDREGFGLTEKAAIADLLEKERT